MFESAVMSLVLVLSTTAAQPPAAPASSPAAVQAVSETVGFLLQADGPRALERLLSVPAGEFEGKEASQRACILTRLRNSGEADISDAPDPFVRQALEIHRAYWRAAFARPAERLREEAILQQNLQRLLGRPDIVDMTTLGALLEARLKQAGYHSLAGGKTQPLYELMLWRKQETREYEVHLPEGTHKTKVELFDDFASLGWSDYMTCGHSSTGGWATTDALHVVLPRYRNLDAEEFRVSFLGHETQHFADLKRYPGIEQWELEYRAKLTQLAQVNLTKNKVLLAFARSQGDDKTSPHAHANKRVLAALRRRLGLSADADLTAIDVPRLQEAAVAELRADTEARERRQSLHQTTD